MDILEAAFAREYCLLKDRRVILELGGIQAWSLMSTIQLACRHPKFTGPTRDIVKDIARAIQTELANNLVLSKVAEMGWCPDYDEEV